MPIRAEIQFDKLQNGEEKQWLVSLDEITPSKIEAELVAGANGLIINTFEGKVSLKDMIASTTQSVQIMEAVSKPVDILAVMERGSSLSMSVIDIQKTSEIMNFSSHPQRGATIAVMYEKTVTKFFLNIANHLLPNANFVLADNMEDAYAVLKKHRMERV